MRSVEIPAKFNSIRQAALRAIQPIGSANEDSYFYGERTRAGYSLPLYYLVYFLLVELLGFRSLGQAEKVAWSVPITFEGKVYVIEHRKLGLGVAAFFEWLAEQAVAKSKLNVENRSASLFARFEYLRDLYRKTADEAESRKDERIVKETRRNGGVSQIIRFPALELRKNAE